MSFLSFLFPSHTAGNDEKTKLQCDYAELHQALERTEEACHEVEEAIRHLEEDNLQLALSILESKKE